MNQLTTNQVEHLDKFLDKIRASAVAFMNDGHPLRLIDERKLRREDLSDQSGVVQMRYVGHKFTVEVG